MRKVDWENLDAYPLSLVLDKLEEHIDHVRFGMVCKNWLSVAKLNHKNHQFRINVPPMLMILSDQYYRIHTISQTEKRSLYSIISEKEYPIQLSHPSINTMKVCLGCSHGWLALVDYNNAVTLVNPFKCSIAPISLPPLQFVDKVTLSADPITSLRVWKTTFYLSQTMVIQFLRPPLVSPGWKRIWFILFIKVIRMI
jgi:hypothetical protein